VREPLIVLDAEGRIGLANDAFYSLFDETADRTTNRMLWDIGQGAWNDPELRQRIQSACRGESSIEDLQIRRVLPGLGERTLVLNAEAIRREDRPTLLLLAIQDVTDARQAESLRIDTETLRLINRRKDEFLGILAHELRNPLAPMRFGLEILRQSSGDSKATKRAREVLERQVGHMVRIVDDLLDVSRITQGKVELRKEPLKLGDVITAAVEFCQAAADAARLTLTVSLPDYPVIMQGDAVRLTQVVVNLLNNAIKFTPPVGHIWVIAEVSEGEDERHLVRIRVRDTGIGIAPEMKHRIFEMFIQGDRTLERTRGGLGVGLTLVQSLVTLHGGTVDAWSEGIGRGSEFVITLPIDVPKTDDSTRALPAAPRRDGRSLRILVADDDFDGREMLTYLLRHEGHVVEAAANGREALEKAETFKPDVAILDLGMPQANGFEVARQLRAKASGPVPLMIALSGLGQQQDKAQAIEAGFDQHFTKPIEFSLLMSAINQSADRG
jgi:two-component system CheB/CheR fusion protein